MYFKRLFYLIVIFTLQFNQTYSLDIKIVLKIDNIILTNVDIENEKKYLLLFNSNLINVNDKELIDLSKSSLIRQVIKEKEVKKYFKFETHSKLGDKLIEEYFASRGYKNQREFSKFLIKQNLDIDIFKEKLLIDRLWNSLVYEKFKNKIKINENEIKKKVEKFINSQDKVYEYNLSEILFEYNTNYKQLMDFIEKYGFEAAASKYSISDTSVKGGKIGWIKNSNLNEKLKKQISKLNEGQISSPIEIPNGNLLIKLNQKRELESKIDPDIETKKQINFDQNRQLNSFSLNFYKKIKQNSIINEY